MEKGGFSHKALQWTTFKKGLQRRSMPPLLWNVFRVPQATTQIVGRLKHQHSVHLISLF